MTGIYPDVKDNLSDLGGGGVGLRQNAPREVMSNKFHADPMTITLHIKAPQVIQTILIIYQDNTDVNVITVVDLRLELFVRNQRHSWSM